MIAIKHRTYFQIELHIDCVAIVMHMSQLEFNEHTHLTTIEHRRQCHTNSKKRHPFEVLVVEDVNCTACDIDAELVDGIANRTA